MSANFPKLSKRTVGALVIALLTLLPLGSAQLSAQTSKEKRAEQRRTSVFNLRSGPFAVLNANLVTCGISNEGEVCSDVFDSPTGGGGFWPTGTTNQYIFNSGLQIAGINADDPANPWRADTVGAYFFDARGTQPHGSPLSDVYNSLDAKDLENWPTGAYVNDTTLFNSQLMSASCLAGTVTDCPKAISDQDSYVEYWDGDPNRISAREHPMGIKVQQRSLAFNAPSGAENTIFFFYTFSNVTNCHGQADYPCNGLDFQGPNEDKFKINLPDTGWTITNVYSAFAMDPDVSSAGSGTNFSTAVLPFNMGIAYHATFQPSDFNYNIRSFLYAPPFFPGSGFVGVKYLRSPISKTTHREVGLTLFTNTTNPSSANSAFPDPLGVPQLFRYLKGDVQPSSGDRPCSFANPIQLHLCAVLQGATDTRFTQVSGPFDLGPGESQTIVVAYTHGAPVRASGFTPGVITPPGTPSRYPGYLGQPIQTVERIAGLTSAGVAPAVSIVGNDTIVNENLVPLVPRSVLDNGRKAQQIFSVAHFLLPRPPASPEFVLVPGDRQVSIVWQPSATDTAGDPFYAIASQPTINGQPNQLYNPNYKRRDVVGYRIYRSDGLTGEFRMIAQFVKSGDQFLQTAISSADIADTFADVTCEFDQNFVPEDTTTANKCVPSDISLAGTVVGYLPGGRVRNAITGTGEILPQGSDTLQVCNLVEGEAACPLTSTTGVPYGYVDRDLKNGITYRYSVVAFDLNAPASVGGLSLESPRRTKTTVPRAEVTNMQLAGFTASVAGDDGTALNTDAAAPKLDGSVGTFDGPMPPTNGLVGAFTPLIPRLLPQFTLTATIDSVVGHAANCPGGSNWQGQCWQAFVTYDKNGVKNQSAIYGWNPIWVSGDASHNEVQLGGAAIAPEAGAAAAFNLPTGFPGFQAGVEADFSEAIYYSGMEGQFNRRIGACNSGGGLADSCTSRVHGGSRWFSGANETTPHPTTWTRHGKLPGVDTIASVMNHTPPLPGAAIPTSSTAIQSFYYSNTQYMRMADVQFTWGAGGTVTKVRDITHHVDVPFNQNPRGSWGFLTTDKNGNGKIDWDDFNYLDTPLELCKENDFCSSGSGGTIATTTTATPARLVNTAVLGPISISGSPASTTGPATLAGNPGIALYINGEKYFFQMAALPAAGTVWTLRTYSGIIRTANASGALDNPATATVDERLTASGYTFAERARRPAFITGIKVSFSASNVSALVGEPDLKKVHTVPDPYYIRSQYELGPSNKALRFVNLPQQAVIRIYTLNGTLVRVLEHNDLAATGVDQQVLGGSAEAWDLRNRNNQFVASGVYFYVVEAASGEKHVGRFTVVQFAR